MVKAYNLMAESTGIPNAQRLTDPAKINAYMTEEFITTVGDVLDKNGPMRAYADLTTKLGRRSGSPHTLDHISDIDTSASFGGAVAGVIAGVTGSPKNQTQTIATEQATQGAIESITKKPSIISSVMESASNTISSMASKSGIGSALTASVVGLAGGLIASGYASGNPLNDARPETITQESSTLPLPNFGGGQPNIAPNNTGGYIININGNTRKGNRQLKRALKHAANASVGGGVNVNMNIRSSNSAGYSDKDIENVLNEYF